ncbi:putative aminoacrylate hydrolase RutD [Mycobacterium sp. MFM001]|uniref:alpha/beta fold hydrolase n=1 Tax=Mycobacterium sp. MFM001 TaxID=2049453 RepID=UPI000DA5825B|nr:alpha/beta fold hydrolase [Mycobacterium sp. MFM001]GBE64608.1 putative aminoacrylate hydrolase RutD [Mycobacterium sp. MFM001]
MATLHTHEISLYYETYGDPAGPPVLLISGLGGTGKSWIGQIDRFAADYYVVVPDQRGTGESSRAESGYTTAQLAADTASLVEYLDVGPMHIVGASTGGAIGQCMALDHPHTVRSLTMVASFARFDAFMTREFAVRRQMAADWDRHALLSAYALFLFSPKYAREHPDRVAAWIDRAAAQPDGPRDRAIALQRIDMIAAHDTLPRLRDITQPALVICGDQDFCTPPGLSEEISDAVPGCESAIVAECGHLVEHEKPDEFYRIVSGFIGRAG